MGNLYRIFIWNEYENIGNVDEKGRFLGRQFLVFTFKNKRRAHTHI